MTSKININAITDVRIIGNCCGFIALSYTETIFRPRYKLLKDGCISRTLIMPLAIAFDLIDSSESCISLSLLLAELNKTRLGNDSFITINSGIKISIEQVQKLQKFPSYSYQNREQLDEFLTKNRINIIFRNSNIITPIIPLTVPLCVYGSESGKHGDLFIDYKEWAPLENNYDQLIGQFTERVINPGLRIVPNLAYHTGKNLLAVSIGSKHQDQLSVIKTDFLRENRPQISHSITPNTISSNSSMVVSNNETAFDRLRKTVLDIDSKSLTSSSTNKLKIKFLPSWTTPSQLLEDWKQMLIGTVWDKQYEWLGNDGTADYSVIINKPTPGYSFDPEKTIVFRMEPYIDNIPVFNDWDSGTRRKGGFMAFMDHENFRNNSEWWLSGTNEQLSKPIVKSALLSIVVSSQYQMKGHKLRIDFVKYFQAHGMIPLDVFGHDNKHGFDRYQGSLPRRCKDRGILPYKYHIAVENSDIPNYLTEKFLDGLLGECLVFYWGCSNISEHIDPRCFIRLNLENPAEATETIVKAIAEDAWSKKIDIIRHEKARVLHLWHPFARVGSLIKARSNIEFIQLLLPISTIQNIPGIRSDTRMCNSSALIDHKLLSYYIPTMFSPIDYIRITTHISIWREAISNNKAICVIEGQVESNFLDHITTILAHISHEEINWDMITLRWGDQSTNSNGYERKQILEPLVPFIVNSAPYTQEGRKLITSGQIGSGYIINHSGARKLIEFIDKYGILGPLEDFLLIFQNCFNDFKCYLSWKDLVSQRPILQSTEPYHILRKGSDGKFNNQPYNFSWPLSLTRPEIMILSDSQLKAHIANNKN